MDHVIINSIATVIASLGGASGLWAWMQKRSDKNSAAVKLLRGLAHEKVVNLGAKYIERGWLTMDEYEDFVHYIYEPYAQVGGNGLAERVYKEVSQLPVKNRSPKTSDLQIVKD